MSYCPLHLSSNGLRMNPVFFAFPPRYRHTIMPSGRCVEPSASPSSTRSLPHSAPRPLTVCITAWMPTCSRHSCWSTSSSQPIKEFCKYVLPMHGHLFNLQYFIIFHCVAFLHICTVSVINRFSCTIYAPICHRWRPDGRAIFLTCILLHSIIILYCVCPYEVHDRGYVPHLTPAWRIYSPLCGSIAGGGYRCIKMMMNCLLSIGQWYPEGVCTG